MEIPFLEVLNGEKFISEKGKRRFGGVKIAPTEISKDGSETYTGNTVILTDHVDELAHDAGAIINTGDTEMVGVSR